MLVNAGPGLTDYLTTIRATKEKGWQIPETYDDLMVARLAYMGCIWYQMNAFHADVLGEMYIADRNFNSQNMFIEFIERSENG